MKTFQLLSGCMIAALMAFVVPAVLGADGARVVRTRVDDFSSPFSLVSPCNGEAVEGVVEGAAHLVFVTDPTGGEHVNLFSVVHGTGIAGRMVKVHALACRVRFCGSVYRSSYRCRTIAPCATV